MRTVNIGINELNSKLVLLGFVGENEHTKIVINCTSVFSDYPSAVPALTVYPPQGQAYPAVADRDGNDVVWIVADSDLAHEGDGEIQLAFTESNVIVKSCIGRIRVSRSIEATGEAPESIDNWLIEANTALNAIPQTIADALEDAKDSGEFDGFSPVVTITEITGGHEVTITDADGDHEFDVLDGEKGDKGDTGNPGHSPVVTASKSGKITTVSVDGSPIATINDGDDGQDGQDGADGQDGYSPTATVTKSGKVATITITDKNGTTTETVSDGADADPTTLIDDTSTAQNKVWSASKTSSEVSDLKSAINQLIYILEYNSAGGGKTLPYTFVNGYSYTVTNGTSASMSCRTADSSGNDVQVISAGISSGSSYTFTANADAPNFKYYSGGSGKITVICNSKRVPVLENKVSVIETNIETERGARKKFDDSIIDGITIDKSTTGGKTVIFGFKNGKTYNIYNGTSANMSCRTKDMSGTDIQVISNGIASDSYFEFTATADAPQFNCYSGGTGTVVIECIDTEIYKLNDILMNISTWHGNVHGANHRGYNSIAPENTIPAFVLSRKKGFSIVESDVQFTSDNVPVMLHDTSINRTARNSDGSELSSTVNIADITYEQALAYDFGIWKGQKYAGTKIPTLTEFLVLCKRLGLYAYIEIKGNMPKTQVETVVQTVETCGMRGNVSYICFSDQPLAHARDADNYARIGVLSGGINEGQINLCEALRTGHNEVFISSSSYTAAEISLCKAAHIPLEIWTIDNVNTLLNADPYISGVTSNTLNAGFVLLQKALNAK